MKKILIYALIFISFNVFAQQLAFPTAVGDGAYTTGGRGGTVCHVNTLTHDAAAVYDATTGTYSGGFESLMLLDIPAKQIVFDVSGTIVLDSGTTWDYSSHTYKGNITVNGQTAPGKIVISVDYFQILNPQNIIFRYLSFYDARQNYSEDVLWIFANNNQTVSDIIIDHCSFYYGVDECLSISSTSAGSHVEDITVQNCVMGASAKGSLLGSLYEGATATMAYSLYVDIDHRFPNQTSGTGGQIDAVNNFVENYGNRLNRITGGGKFNVINNYAQPNRANYGLHMLQYDSDAIASVWSEGMVVSGVKDVPTSPDFDRWAIFAGSDVYNEWDPLPSNVKASERHQILGKDFTIYNASELKTSVVPFTGNNQRVNEKGSFIDDSYALDDFYKDLAINPVATTNYYRYPAVKFPSPLSGTPYDDTDKDGMADTWEIAKFGNLSKTGKIDSDGDGYTDFENFVNGSDDISENTDTKGSSPYKKYKILIISN